MSLETIAPLSEIQSSSCPQWQPDRPGPAGDHDGLAVVTPMGHDLYFRRATNPISLAGIANLPYTDVIVGFLIPGLPG